MYLIVNFQHIKLHQEQIKYLALTTECWWSKKEFTISAETTQNSGKTIVFHEQDFADPKLLFCGKGLSSYL